MNNASRLVVIPAPIHSDHIPRMMLRRLVDQPLLARVITIADRTVSDAGNIIILTDDDEVALLAERLGCKTFVYPSNGQQNGGFLWHQVYRVILGHEQKQERQFQTIALLQPSSPLLQAGDFEHGDEILSDDLVDSVIAVGRQQLDRHPELRLFRDQPPSNFMPQDFGAFSMTKRQAISPNSFWGRRVKFAFIPDNRALELRTPHDWWVCEKLLAQKRIVFVVAGNTAIGMGHVYRALLLAHELMDHQITFVCTSDSELAARQLAANQFPTFVQMSEDLADEVLQFEPDLVINDFLDTDRGYVLRLKEKNIRLINIEDMGTGAAEADLVINALYEQDIPLSNHRVGPDYFCLRDEFLQAAPASFHSAVRQALITFGGTDDADLTRRIFEIIFPAALELGVRLSIMIGPGYVHAQSLQRRIAMLHSELVEIVNGTKRISEYMARADLAFSSAGRTVFELVTMRVPSIIFAANEREELHTFASPQNGLAYLGRHDEVTDREILRAFHDLIEHPEKRKEMYERMARHDFRAGKKRVIDEILSLLYTPIEEEKFLCPA